jgi:hypothetical protein
MSSSEFDVELYELSVSDPSKFQELRRGTMDEVLRRVRESPDSIADTHLFRLFSEINRIQLQIEKGTSTPQPDRDESILDLIDSDGLPFERKKELLKTAIGELVSRGLEATEHRAALERIVGRKNADELLSIEAHTTQEEEEDGTTED